MSSFSQGYGRWAGSAEVFDGQGRFLGNGADNRHVQNLGGGRTRIDVSFVGPFKHSGHYVIDDRGDHRLYQGPANIGYAEVLSDSLVDAKAYWPALGLTQRFMLMVLPGGDVQLSLAHMQRGEEVLYVVVGQNDRVPDVGLAPPPSLVSGTSYDLAGDPTAGRGSALLHRAGRWRGALTTLGADRAPLATVEYAERVRVGPSVAEGSAGELVVEIEGGAFIAEHHSVTLRSNGRQAWTPAGESFAGSYSLSGGRALSGHFYHLDTHVRVWRREIVSHDGSRKALLHCFYRGDARIGAQFGVLEFSAA